MPPHVKLFVRDYVDGGRVPLTNRDAKPRFTFRKSTQIPLSQCVQKCLNTPRFLPCSPLHTHSLTPIATLDRDRGVNDMISHFQGGRGQDSWAFQIFNTPLGESRGNVVDNAQQIYLTTSPSFFQRTFQGPVFLKTLGSTAIHYFALHIEDHRALIMYSVCMFDQPVVSLNSE